jgi:hypothetical protein
MSVWRWFFEYEKAAAESGDERRQLLSTLFWEAHQRLRDLPDAALAGFERSQRLALSLKEPWWVLFFEHWKLQCLLHYKQDVTRALPLAVTATMEARKPAYAGCPQRLCIHDDLIAAYLDLDAPGYAPEVEEALKYMEAEVSEDFECRQCILSRRATLADALDRLDVLEQVATGMLARAQECGDPHHACYGHRWLCYLAYRQGEPEEIALHAGAGLAGRGIVERPVNEAVFLTWQAYLARLEGDQRTARRRLRRAEAVLARTARLPSGGYYTARCAYHALKGEREEELAVREQELAQLVGKSQHFWEASTRLEQCRLLAELGRPLEEAAAEARRAIGRLRQPAELLARLAEIERRGQRPEGQP